MNEVLKALQQHMTAMGLEYEFETYTGEKNPYWIGEYYGAQDSDEGGYMTHSPLLTGFAIGAKAELYDQADRARKYFQNGATMQVDDTSVACWVQAVMAIPQETEELTKIQITLKVQTWERC